MFTTLSMYVILRTRGLIELDVELVKFLATPVIVGFLLAVSLDVSIIKFILTH